MPRHDAPLSPTETVAAFKALAEEHALQRRDTDCQAAWAKIQVARANAVSQRRRVSPWVLRSVAAAALVAGVAGAASFWAGEDSLSYELAGAHVGQGAIQTFEEPATIAFSDGSRLEAAPRTTLHLDVVGNDGARTHLTRGKVRVSVEHAANTDWRFYAGPYEVRVVGTVFDLSWDPQAQHLSVAMHSGQVDVFGPSGERARVGAGQTLDLGPQQPTVIGGDGAEPELALDVDSATVSAQAEDSRALAPSSAAASSPSPEAEAAVAVPTPAPKLSWTALVAAGEFSSVVAAARAEGERDVLHHRPLSDLRALAQAANYSGQPSLAIASWKSIRARGSSPAQSAEAAFFLARIHDQAGRQWESMRWLETYLAEAPTGVYASEALGRKLTLSRQLRSAAEARRVAREYLERFPEGPYAGTARDTLDRD